MRPPPSTTSLPPTESFEPYEEFKPIPLPVLIIAVALALWGVFTLLDNGKAVMVGRAERSDQIADPHASRLISFLNDRKERLIILATINH